MLGCCLRSDALLRRRPQVQFLLLAALNEALASLAAPSSDSATLSDAQRDEVRQGPRPTPAPAPCLDAVRMNRRSKSPGHSPAVALPLCSVPHGFVAVVDIAYFCNLPLCVSCGTAMCADPDRTTSPGHSGI